MVSEASVLVTPSAFISMLCPASSADSSTPYRKPVIGAINGFAMGGGSEMVVNLDLAVAGQSATFGFPEAKRGVTVGAGGVPRLARLVGHNKGARILLISEGDSSHAP